VPAQKNPIQAFGGKPEIVHGEPAQDPSDPGVLKRTIAASAIGNATEWFDYGIYAYGVGYISAAIFPGDTEQATLLARPRLRFRSWSVRWAGLSGARSATE
jgi:MFS transporter, MHS family, proline/betaine transporter